MTLPVTDFIVERLLEYDPTFDTGPGLATTGLVIEPLAVILQPVVDELAVVQAVGSVLAILESSDPDLFPEDIVDGLASNAFVTRKPGAIGSTIERMRFFEPEAFSAGPGVLIFRGSDGQRYTNSQAVSISKAEMSLNQDGSLYFVDLPLQALQEGAGFNVKKGGISTMEAEPAGVANVTNLFDVDQGRSRETNTELIARIKVAITVRALVTGRGIVVTLTEAFTSIVEIQPIGFKQPEMMRDIVYNVHIGGNVDVYIRTSTMTELTHDVADLVIDTSRRRAGASAVLCPDANVAVGLSNSSIDRTDRVPVVTSGDGLATFTEGVDYDLVDSPGSIARRQNHVEDGADPTPSTILHVTGSAGVVSVSKRLTETGRFADARTGMVITISAPSALIGQYTVKTTDPDFVEIFGLFPISSAGSVQWSLDEELIVSYDYNPIAVDVIATARALDRAPYTITDVPLMLLETVELLDPISGNPTGTLLNGIGGYGAGGYGAGPYGVGSGPEYQLVVAEPTLRFSAKEDSYIEFVESKLGTSVRVTYLVASAIPTIQAFIDDPDNRTEAASLLAKHFVPIYVDSREDIAYVIAAASQATAISATAMGVLVKAFINQIGSGAPLELSDLVDLLYNNGAKEVDLDGLEKLRGSLHHENGTVEFVDPDVRGVMHVPSDPIPDPTDKPMSPRIARFIAHDIVLARSVG